jgi:hypothetical protein
MRSTEMTIHHHWGSNYLSKGYVVARKNSLPDLGLRSRCGGSWRSGTRNKHGSRMGSRVEPYGRGGEFVGCARCVERSKINSIRL